jgi:hypothetical protein
MTNPFTNNNFLMRVKDYILLALAVIGLLGYLSKGFTLAEKLEQTEKEISAHRIKYEPLADEMKVKLAVVDQKFDTIIETLKEIKRYQRGDR